MRKILFCIPSLVGGGSERVFVHLMNNLDRERYSVHLAVLRRRGDFLDNLRPDIAVHDLSTDILGALFKMPSCIAEVQPDIILSTICYMNMVVGFSRLVRRRSRTLFCARESDIPSLMGKVSWSVWNASVFYITSYRFLDHVICQSEHMRDDVHKCYRVPFDKMVIINNPIDIDLIRENVGAANAEGFLPDKINIVAIGRLNYVKGYDMLFQAMARTTNKRLHLHMLGQGELLKELTRLAGDLGIADRVTFHGFKPNPYPYMRAASAFVLSSRYEGFPNAVAEAQSLGCPTIAFNCPGGVRELVEHGVDGFIVPFGDVDALARELDRGAYLSLDRDRIAERVLRRFDISAILRQYEDLFGTDNAISRKGGLKQP
ncbi:MAG: glycosyltransferase [Candidatus Krumholzibacteriaceae bacterium]|jgi:glycosyltransferase involved in cell wall biosynthesis